MTLQDQSWHVGDSTLLVIDMDFFFPNPALAAQAQHEHSLLYDWGHEENAFMTGPVWDSRAAQFLARELPLPPLAGWEEFWDRFPDLHDVPLWFANSNLHAGDMFPGDVEAWKRVVLFDAHHDCGYRVGSLEDFAVQPRFSCEDWMLRHAVRGSALEVRYPRWRPQAIEQEPLPRGVEVTRVIDDGGLVVDVVPDAVFVCMSHGWVPPWCDEQVEEFLDRYPGVIVGQIDEDPVIRAFCLDSVAAEAASWHSLREEAIRRSQSG
ncbi:MULTISPECIES: hypothetical protein [unclassified Crossiella]|uniref:hypothetical protein n=1 Tax=unclassified Crossiella TaxID=2620835 RepID=UPI001FFE9139|nr:MULTISPECIES: hypothetical protein [unclassified Crossiella]MCK2240056.1 hypothetical protein [Crossiella sp. S99.2]MCK2252764.1 hypothetical protein [Crossiella sp. S99.1]